MYLSWISWCISKNNKAFVGPRSTMVPTTGLWPTSTWLHRLPRLIPWSRLNTGRLWRRTIRKAPLSTNRVQGIPSLDCRLKQTRPCTVACTCHVFNLFLGSFRIDHLFKRWLMLARVLKRFRCSYAVSFYPLSKPLVMRLSRSSILAPFIIKMPKEWCLLSLYIYLTRRATIDTYINEE